MKRGRYHIIIDMENVTGSIHQDKARLEQFLNELPGEIGMTVLYGPAVVEGIPINPGLTGFVIIEFSHISIHTFSESSQVLVDIFSCKEFDQEDAIAATLDYCQADRSQVKIQTVSWE